MRSRWERGGGASSSPKKLVCRRKKLKIVETPVRDSRTGEGILVESNWIIDRFLAAHHGRPTCDVIFVVFATCCRLPGGAYKTSGANILICATPKASVALASLLVLPRKHSTRNGPRELAAMAAFGEFLCGLWLRASSAPLCKWPTRIVSCKCVV